MIIEKTSRGFEIITFKDRYGEECSLQQSSLAENERPGSSAVWLGVNRGRMHLDRDQVAELIKHLAMWAIKGSFEV